MYTPVDFDGEFGVLVDMPPEVYEVMRFLYTWPAASTLNVVVASGIPLVRKHIISVLASETVRPNAVHTVTIIITAVMSLGLDP